METAIAETSRRASVAAIPSTRGENARLKAAYYATASGLVTVAEDSGLAIDALDGRPGIHSARYPGDTYLAKFANPPHWGGPVKRDHPSANAKAA